MSLTVKLDAVRRPVKNRPAAADGTMLPAGGCPCGTLHASQELQCSPHDESLCPCTKTGNKAGRESALGDAVHAEMQRCLSKQTAGLTATRLLLKFKASS